MRLTKEQFHAFIGAVWSRDTDRTRSIALQIASHNAKDPEVALIVNRALMRDRPNSAIPHDLAGCVREVEPWFDVDQMTLDPAIAAVVDAVFTENAYAEELAARGLDPTCRLMFHGPSGTGKTSAACVLAARMGLPLLVVPMDQIISSYLGESSARLRKVCEFVAKAPPAVVLLDEIDAIGLARGDKNDVGEQGRIVTTLLVLLDELRRQRSRSVLIAATNRHESLDTALTRRFDTSVEFSLPSDAQKTEIARRIFARAGVVGPSVPGGLESHADVERWALGEARRIVLGGVATRAEVAHG